MDLRDILDFPTVYSIWQWPFAEQKTRSFLQNNDVDSLGRVLEIGCGPGTNAKLFSSNQYLGIDLNARYIGMAKRRYGDKFICGDAANLKLDSQTKFDTVFMNSLLHHLDDDAINMTMEGILGVISRTGRIHILDLVLPPNFGLPRIMAKLDRGNFPRDCPNWKSILGRHFEIELFHEFNVSLCGIPCWRMYYLRGLAT